jgi:hypothetical protein
VQCTKNPAAEHVADLALMSFPKNQPQFHAFSARESGIARALPQNNGHQPCIAIPWLRQCACGISSME